MTLLEIFLIGVGLSMDAFAVAVGKGLTMKRLDVKQAIIIAAFFGGFQALMPAIGWALGAQFAHFVTSVDHWVAFILLTFIGGKMIWDALHEDDGQADESDSSFSIRELFILAIATSIDALAMGVTFAFLEVNIVVAASLIGVTTFALSLVGVGVGRMFGSRWEKISAFAGGVVLIIIGVKILLENLLA